MRDLQFERKQEYQKGPEPPLNTSTRSKPNFYALSCCWLTLNWQEMDVLGCKRSSTCLREGMRCLSPDDNIQGHLDRACCTLIVGQSSLAHPFHNIWGAQSQACSDFAPKQPRNKKQPTKKASPMALHRPPPLTSPQKVTKGASWSPDKLCIVFNDVKIYLCITSTSVPVRCAMFSFHPFTGTETGFIET